MRETRGIYLPKCYSERILIGTDHSKTIRIERLKLEGEPVDDQDMLEMLIFPASSTDPDADDYFREDLLETLWGCSVIAKITQIKVETGVITLGVTDIELDYSFQFKVNLNLAPEFEIEVCGPGPSHHVFERYKVVVSDTGIVLTTLKPESDDWWYTYSEAVFCADRTEVTTYCR